MTLVTGTLTTIIDDYLSTRPQDEPRLYVGASSIGHPCERKIWYGYKGIAGEPITPTTRRTFDIGHKLEGLILDYLKQSKNYVFIALNQCDKDIPEFQGTPDGIWKDYQDNPLGIIEVKTARDSSFRVFVKKGLKEWYPAYYAQVQAYMGMSGIHKTYLIAINKDTSELWDEQVLYDDWYYSHLKAKAQRVIVSIEPPERIHSSPMYFVCKSCQYRKICHE